MGHSRNNEGGELAVAAWNRLVERAGVIVKVLNTRPDDATNIKAIQACEELTRDLAKAGTVAGGIELLAESRGQCDEYIGANETLLSVCKILGADVDSVEAQAEMFRDKSRSEKWDATDSWHAMELCDLDEGGGGDISYGDFH